MHLDLVRDPALPHGGPIATITLNRPDRLNIVPPIQVHGWCVGGGSDMAVGADLAIAAEDAQIGTPRPDQSQGARAHRQPFSGREAADAELIHHAAPFERLEAEVADQARQLASIPASQLAAMKLIVNQAYENMGLRAAQTRSRARAPPRPEARITP